MGVWVIEQSAIILSATIRSPTVLLWVLFLCVTCCQLPGAMTTSLKVGLEIPVVPFVLFSLFLTVCLCTGVECAILFCADPPSFPMPPGICIPTAEDACEPDVRAGLAAAPVLAVLSWVFGTISLLLSLGTYKSKLLVLLAASRRGWTQGIYSSWLFMQL